ncbi:hypothetical protein QZH41_019902, partial [Actinostola sp. cb2023]
RENDAAILLTNNSIRALKQMVFRVTRGVFSMKILPAELRGYSVSLSMVLVWAVRQSRLHNDVPETVEINIKLDGRPLAGIVNTKYHIGYLEAAVQLGLCCSCCSVYLFVFRDDVKTFITRLNEEKCAIKESGLTIDGRLYKFNFKG